MNSQSPAQLFVVPQPQALTYTQHYLKSVLCSKQGCQTCVDCSLIDRKQHHSVLWVCPEKRYTLDVLDGIFKRIEFSLEQDQNYFFVVEKADFLTPACANSLLKIVEEPPPGYHFIFVAQRTQQVLPTIRSRCSITSLVNDAHNQPTGPFAPHFTHLESDPQAFLKELSKNALTEIESAELVNTFLEFWSSEYAKALSAKAESRIITAQKMVILFKDALLKPAMPGSTKIFWRNLFLKKETIDHHV